MPRAYAMTWNAAGNRWFKKYKGRQYAVSCRVLGTRDTIAASWQAANDWWQTKLAEINAAAVNPFDEPFQAIEAFAPDKLNDPKLRNMVATMTRFFEQFAEVAPEKTLDDPTFRQFAEVFAGERAKKQIAKQPTTDANRIGVNIEKFLARKRTEAKTGKVSVGRFAELKTRLNYFGAFVGIETDTNEIKAATMERYNSRLLERLAAGDWSQSTIADYWQSAKQFVNWCWTNSLLKELPRNLNDRALRITIDVTANATYPLERLKQVLAACTDNNGTTTGRMRLFLLLMMNCGMTQQDISDLQPAEVDWVAGTITRKRSKTSRFENVPTVTYKLWPETFDLLKQFGSQAGEPVKIIHNGRPTIGRRVFVSEKGNALVFRNLNGKEGESRTDNVRAPYYRIMDKLAIKGDERNTLKLKFIRKTSASFMESAGNFGRLFLGHAPRGVADRHYLTPDQSKFDACVYKLGQFYGIVAAAAPAAKRQRVKPK